MAAGTAYFGLMILGVNIRFHNEDTIFLFTTICNAPTEVGASDNLAVLSLPPRLDRHDHVPAPLVLSLADVAEGKAAVTAVAGGADRERRVP